MPDWKELVRERLGSQRLPESAEKEVIAELAAHLEDFCEDERRQGRSESEARKRALANIRWRELAWGIRGAKRKEDEMNQRTKSLWLPAMANLTLAAAMLVILDKVNLQPRMTSVGHMAMAFHIPWLLALPVSGAVGALLAKRAQASSGERLLAGLAPSLVWLAVFGVMGLAFALDWNEFAGFPLNYFALAAVAWVVLPAVALLVGTLPFLREGKVSVCGV
jgi:hypothetical protein